MSGFLRPHGLQPTRVLCPWDSPSKSTGVGCHAHLQGILPVQGSNPCLLQLLHWQEGLGVGGVSLLLKPPGKPIFMSQFSSVQFSRSVVSDSLRPCELQHARPPCPSPTPRVYPNPCPSIRGCHPAISSSGVPFSSCPQSLPASESFPMSQLFTRGGQSIGVSALASVLPVNTQD